MQVLLLGSVSLVFEATTNQINRKSLPLGVLDMRFRIGPP